MKYFFSLLFFFIFSMHSTSHADDVIALGTPLIKIESSFESTKRYELSETEMSEYILVIVFSGKEIRWKSRNNKLLTYTRSGAFHHFVNESGSGYIKIGDISQFTGGSEKQYLYIEHIHLGFSTITYWGVIDSFLFGE